VVTGTLIENGSHRLVVGQEVTKNQVLGGRTANRSEPRKEECPRLHQLVHQRLQTTMDILGPEPNDEAHHREIAGSCGVLPVTTDHITWRPQSSADPLHVGGALVVGACERGIGRRWFGRWWRICRGGGSPSDRRCR
jgi:hypothetical protein